MRVKGLKIYVNIDIIIVIRYIVFFDFMAKW